MTIWAFNKPNDKKTINFLAKSLKKGITRFGWSYSDECNLKKLELKPNNQCSDKEIENWNNNKFLLNIKKGDWIVQINIPFFGVVTAGLVIEEYNFGKDNEIHDFRHFFKLDKTTVIEFDRNDPNIDPKIIDKLKLQGRYWQIKPTNVFLKSIKKLTTREEKNFPKIKKIELSNFINFSDIKLEFSPSINLIIGKNNTGKTNLLKFLYSVIKSSEKYIKQKKLYDRTYKSILSNKIQETFQSSKDGIGTIVSKKLINKSLCYSRF